MSITEKTEIRPQKFKYLGKEGEIESYFLNGLKNGDKESFIKIINEYQDFKGNRAKLPYAYYELGILYLQKQEYSKALEQLEISQKISLEETHDQFLTIKIYIKIAEIQNLINNKQKSMSLLKEALKIKENKYCHHKEYIKNLINKLNGYYEPSIFMLNANPLVINKGNFYGNIYAHHNNQYYILDKLSDSLSKKNLFVKSYVLNKNNLIEVFKKKGKVLIIQSDGFSAKGEIFLETINGTSEKLTEKELMSILPQKLKFELVILCFCQSEKMKEIFKKTNIDYLITFDKINITNLQSQFIIKYNQLSIEFLILYIQKLHDCNIEKSFEESRSFFVEKISDFSSNYNKNINWITLSDLCTLKKKFLINYFDIQKENTNPYNLISLPIKNSLSQGYNEDIFNIIKLLLKQKIVNIYLENENKSSINNCKEIFGIKYILCTEILKHFHRHQYFKGGLFYFHKSIRTQYKILNEINKENEPEKNILFVIEISGNLKRDSFFLEKFTDSYFLLISNSKIEGKNWNYEIKQESRNIPKSPNPKRKPNIIFEKIHKEKGFIHPKYLFNKKVCFKDNSSKNKRKLSPFI